MSLTSVVEVREWLVALLKGDAALVALLGTNGDGYDGVYDEKAPESAPYDFIVIGGTEEGRGTSAFGSSGAEGVESIRISTRPAALELVGSAKAKAIYRHVHRLLNGVVVSLEGGAMLWNAKVRLVTTFVEPDGITTTAPVQFTFNTMQA